MTELQDTSPPAAPQPAAHRGVSPNAFYLLFACLVLGAALVLIRPSLGVITFAFVCVAWIASVVVHEFGHAYVAHLAGDTSIEGKGYLTLDPLKYSNLQTTIILPLIALALGGIGFPGAAVYLREDLMRSARGRSLASLAGPAGTLAVLLAIDVALWGMGLMQWFNPLYAALAFLAYLQATALILNLLPVPGFDGYGVIRPFLPDALRLKLRKFEPVAFMLMFALIFFVPAAGELLFGTAARLAQAVGIRLDAAQAGMDSFRFWKSL
jgi:Zn-dependent protease